MQTGIIAVAAATAALTGAGGYALGTSRASATQPTDAALMKALTDRARAEAYLGSLGPITLPKVVKRPKIRRKVTVVPAPSPVVRSISRVAAATTAPSGTGKESDDSGESD